MGQATLHASLHILGGPVKEELCGSESERREDRGMEAGSLEHGGLLCRERDPAGRHHARLHPSLRQEGAQGVQGKKLSLDRI